MVSIIASMSVRGKGNSLRTHTPEPDVHEQTFHLSIPCVVSGAKIVFQSFFMITTFHHYFFDALRLALSFSS